MNDIIHLLPDAVANQIAAGEVVQRPASVVKELLENAVDAGAANIQLIIKDAGRTLIQVVDDGKGMSFNDARLSFERHATSKITSADDLFKLKTKGFRGEALASIAAVAQVEMKTKQADDSVGTVVMIEGSDVKEHAPTATQDGTSISVKNLFFNVPARRNFLKSDNIEFSHIEEEFNRVALVHTDLSFSFYHNGKLLLQLQPSNFKQRIVNLLGTHFKDKLYPVEMATDVINISGFIAKPENAKKKKSEQYMFMNDRFVRHPLLNYAVETAYTQLIPEGYKPAYFLKLNVDPATIDVNISPTKVEVKLQDERLIFGFLNSCVKKSIGTMSLAPQIDFDCETSLDMSHIKPTTDTPVFPRTGANPNYNPFESVSTPKTGGGTHDTTWRKDSVNLSGWSDFLKNIKKESDNILGEKEPHSDNIFEEEQQSEELSFDAKSSFIIQNRYIVLKINDNMTIIDIVAARERILFERYSDSLENQPVSVQSSLFPETVTLSAASAELLLEIKEELLKLGYDIEQIDRTSFAVNGVPFGEEASAVQSSIEELLESYKSNLFLYRSEKKKNIALSLARQKCSRFKPFANDTETEEFVRQLFACQMPYTTPSGKKTLCVLSDNMIKDMFGK
ncbi:MAG: DNA mismatch repair endonuclease MutL [Bacteroidales bacterium]|nr:DNA mismatch repair endonuclease MutL [Bacteroidales bacterium]